MITRGTSLKNNVSKVFSQYSGGWMQKGEEITFYPQLCREMNKEFVLEDVICGEPRPEKIEVINGTWTINVKGKVLKLQKKAD